MIVPLLVALFVVFRCAWAQDRVENTALPSGGVISSLAPYIELGGATADRFRPLTQAGRTKLYLKGTFGPLGFVYGAARAGLHQSWDGPPEWGQGAEGYVKRFGDSYGQFVIRRTLAFGLASVLHEDRRYFGSGKRGFWRRTNYAFASSFLARHDNGKRYMSLSHLGGVAGAAFISGSWEPPGSNSAGDSAVRFGVTMGADMGLSVFKEFLPEIEHPFHKKRH